MKINLATAHLLSRPEPNDDDHIAAEIATELIRAFPKSVLTDPTERENYLIRIFIKPQNELKEVTEAEAGDPGVRVIRVSLLQSSNTDNWCFIHISQPYGPVEPVSDFQQLAEHILSVIKAPRPEHTLMPVDGKEPTVLDAEVASINKATGRA